MKSYKIRTTMDMYNAVTSKNIDGFLKDFEVWLRGVVSVKENLPSDSIGISMADVGLTWNDDGENGIIKGVNIKIENKIKKSGE